ncbi:hypothetical protein LTR99_003000 [Exophiala xenobiotica]|uniref:HIT domain-containing protein n=1 Tax=Vermiconidia calcicola TaxID=1690605 RepID=A0AAV9Q960_9PEZI|nr:hypothetical protein LTR92_005741 [Exophiala xenobiotica]KAK5538669.1 hypothetical protein LTR25_004211 [Vermiconidia calcicola]KAK5547841.1 hypothetical protein LTR23_002090 [Chaetothyriales sp. CCFEE 6169]KAK5212791.1 hypothetical protein LTR41_001739 [Exophiala xenobiotica]KAK5221971.1 hypothetical protein LTR72_006228 [Exophiala xenobiotica]
MSDLPRLVPETSHQSSPHSQHDFSPSCPFCVIARTYGPISPLAAADGSLELDPDKLEPPSFVLYSSEHVIAFLDIMPLTRGHVLVAPRKHRVKVGDLSPDEGAESSTQNNADDHQIGRILPVLARSVIKAVMPDIPHEQADYNVVQNNGPGAAQVVPHVHFHIVPRPPLNYVTPPRPTSALKMKQYPPNAQPSGHKRTMILFGRGMRDDLDDDDAAVLVEDMRQCIKKEWAVSFSVKGEAEVSDSFKGHGGTRKGAWKV